MDNNLAKQVMENNKNNETQNRREFFKEAAKKALPLFAVALIGPSILSSCKKVTDCGSSCSGSCKSSCRGDCYSTCSGSCDDSCSGTCGYSCSYGARYV